MQLLVIITDEETPYIFFKPARYQKKSKLSYAN